MVSPFILKTTVSNVKWTKRFDSNNVAYREINLDEQPRVHRSS